MLKLNKKRKLNHINNEGNDNENHILNDDDIKKTYNSENNEKYDFENINENNNNDEEEKEISSIIVQFIGADGEAGGPISMPVDTTINQMEMLVNQLLDNDENERMPYAFYLNEKEITSSIEDAIINQNLIGAEETGISISFFPLSIFRVKPIGRCTETMPGHTEAILHVSYSPDGSSLASGGGDFTVRFWDIHTCTPKFTCTGHRNHVLCTAWSPTGEHFASGDKNGLIRIWNPSNGTLIGRPLQGHKKWITSLSWQPIHLLSDSSVLPYLISSSRDGTMKIWDIIRSTCVRTLSGHTDSIECVKWGGENLIYSASRDRTIKVWAVREKISNNNNIENNVRKAPIGKLIKTLQGHGHRINTLALNTDFILRTGAYDYEHRNFDSFESKEELYEHARNRYNDFIKQQNFNNDNTGECIVSGSDDFTLILWKPSINKRPIARLVGHQQAVNQIAFSPDARYIASASFDKKIKIWDGKTGDFITTLHGHVGAVYQVAWSADSRHIISGSKDSTVKVWNINKPKKSIKNLSSHEDEIYAIDWSPDGSQAASGSKDRKIKIWKY